MTKLTDTQAVMLSTAAGRPDGSVLPLPDTLRLNKGAATIVVQSLIRKGFVAEVIASLDDDVWRMSDDGERLTLIITDQGLVALGIEPGVEDNHSGDDGNSAKALQDKGPSKDNDHGRAGTSSAGINARQRCLTGHTLDKRSPTPEQKGLSDLKPSPGTPAASPSCGDAQTPYPKPGTRLGLVIQLLQRREGAAIPEIQAATGWQAHSIRGAISGTVRKKLGLKVTAELMADRGRVYHIVPESLRP